MKMMSVDNFVEENHFLILLILGITVILLIILVAFLCCKLHWRKRRSSSPVFGECPIEGAVIASPSLRNSQEYVHSYEQEFRANVDLELGRYKTPRIQDVPTQWIEGDQAEVLQNTHHSDDDSTAAERGAAAGAVSEESEGEVYINSGFQSHGEDEEILMDSALRELMVPDMKESILIEVRSKLIVFISKTIDHQGGTLVLDKMGISLFIPPCAIEPGSPEIIFLALNWDLKDFPHMTPTQTIVSPVVHVGPHGLKLKRQATLSFRHCAFDVSQVKVYSSETHLMQNKTWDTVEEDVSGNQKTHRILDTECQVYISHFTLYTCIAEGESAKKWIQLVAFGKRIGSQYEIRVYLLNDTPCALQFAIENEKKFRFQQIKCPQNCTFLGDGSSMFLEVENINEGWSSSLSDLKEEITFVSIWHGKCPYATFAFKRENSGTKELKVTISARQGAEHKLQLKLLKNIRWREGRRSRRPEENTDSSSSQSESSQVSTDNSFLGEPTKLISDDYFPRSNKDPQMVTYVDADDSRAEPLCSQPCCAPPDSHVIPHELKRKLVQLLEPQCMSGNDWRMIASELGLDSKIPLLSVRNSPFLEVLKIMQEKKKDLKWLEMTLTKHERLDAADLVTHYLKRGG